MRDKTVVDHDMLENSYGIRVQKFKIIDNIKYKNWKFKVVDGGKNCYCYLQLEFWALNEYDNLDSGSLQKSRKWLLSENMTDPEIIQTCFLAVMTAEEHEIRETFTFNNVAIFGPHFDLVTASKNNKDIRE